MAKDLIEKKEPLTPGVGVAGLVMCPFFKGPCLKHGCEKWVELTYGEDKVARCSDSWTPLMLTEIRQAIDRLNIRIDKILPKEDK